MSSIGKLAGSIVAVNNENTLALLNVNLDFSLIRCDPSPEYSKVGSALTVKRKQEAETGALHSVACKLGFLFYELLPDTPKLHQAYGTRISEILAQPGINPQGTEDDGPFRDYVGADCTSIWAAATSGPASICMLLLACMLARAWDAKTATSIWIELLTERTKHIAAQMDANRIVNPLTLSASRQMVTREDLTIWDASVRAWLRRADAAVAKQATQLQLVTKNLSIPFWSAGSTFERVLMNWTRSMEMVEKLLSNVPQEASTRAVLVALSSWHLYPDLLVFQDQARKIPFADPLFPSSAILSTGLEYKGPADNVTQWSLSLSHLRYYGDPVVVCSDKTHHDRVPIGKLWLATLGIIFREWKISYAKFEDAVAWFRVLGGVLRRSTKADNAQFSGLLQLCDAAASVIEANGKLNDGGMIKYGWRRGKNFLGVVTSREKTPFFGLRNPLVISSLSTPSDIDWFITYLRGIAAHMGLLPNEAVISYMYKAGESVMYTEWATAFATNLYHGTMSDASTAAQSNETKHARWLDFSSKTMSAVNIAAIEERRQKIESQAEECHLRDGENSINPPRRPDYPELEVSVKLPVIFKTTELTQIVCLQSLQGLNGSVQLWVTCEKCTETNVNSVLQSLVDARNVVTPDDYIVWLDHVASPEGVAEFLLKPYLSSGASHWFRRLQTEHFSTVKPNLLMEILDAANPSRSMGEPYQSPRKWFVSLNLLGIATHLYEGFTSATVSLKVMEEAILDKKWVPANFHRIMTDSIFFVAQSLHEMMKVRIGLARTFSLIAFFESGHLDIPPEQMSRVLALCSEDSIFVASAMLSDPCEIRGRNRPAVRHLIGNVGYAGMVLMVSPIQPRIRAIGHNPELVEHRPFKASDEDGKGTDSFSGTSLHLSFTTWRMPLDWTDTGVIDQSTFIVESVISVHDKGQWVADIDVLKMAKCRPKIIKPSSCNCHGDATAHDGDGMDAVSIDTWEELLDSPPCTAVFRARSNWPARLAAACILVQQGKMRRVCIVEGDRLCLPCFHSIEDVESDKDVEPDEHVEWDADVESDEDVQLDEDVESDTPYIIIH